MFYTILFYFWYCLQERVRPVRRRCASPATAGSPAPPWSAARRRPGPAARHAAAVWLAAFTHAPWPAIQATAPPAPRPVSKAVLADALRYRYLARTENVSYYTVLRIRKYFFQIRILGAIILTYGSGSRRPINYGSFLDIFLPNEKKYVVKYRYVVNH
jgi:hypothetical protein